MSKTIDHSRRRLLQYMGAGGLGLATGCHSMWAADLPTNSAQNLSFPTDVDIALTAKSTSMPIFNNAPRTQVWKFVGDVLSGPADSLANLPESYLGPTLRLRKGQKVRIRFRNELPENCIVHWHGMHVPEKADGHPRYAIAPGQTYTYEFEVTNRAGTYFYHPHTHMQTASQVYKGLSGLLLVSDREEESLGLPQGEQDIPVVIQDRRFDTDKQFVYSQHMHDQMMGFLGDQVLVNGRPNALLPIGTRAYRLRLLNFSNSRIYKLAWSDGTPIVVIATDGNLLPKPETRPYVTLGVAERVDIWLDCRDRKVGSELELRSLPFEIAMPMMGGGMMMGPEMGRGHRMHGRGMMMHNGMMGRGRHGSMGMSSPNSALGAPFSILKLHIVRKEREDRVLPARLADFTPYQVSNADNQEARVIRLSMQHMSLQLNDRTFDLLDAAADERIPLNSLQLISFDNHHSGYRGMGMMHMRLPHPMHIHGQQFQVIRREIDGSAQPDYQSLSAGFVDSGWKDTVLVMPGEKVTVLKRFDKYEGLFLYHCHNLEHEDMGMMRNFWISS